MLKPHCSGEQQGSSPEQASPAAPQLDDVHAPALQMPLQHCEPKVQETPPVEQRSVAQTPFEQIALQQAPSLWQATPFGMHACSYGRHSPSKHPRRFDVQSSQMRPASPQLWGALGRHTPSAPQHPSGQLFASQAVAPLQAVWRSPAPSVSARRRGRERIPTA